MTTLALTDRDTVAGTVRFATAAAAAGIRPVFGVDVAVAPLTPPDPATGQPRMPVRGGAHVLEPPLRITLFAQNPAGRARLCRLVSAAHVEADGTAPVVPVSLSFAGCPRAGAAMEGCPGSSAQAKWGSWSALRAYADQDLVVLLGPAAEPVRRVLLALADDLGARLRGSGQVATGVTLTVGPGRRHGRRVGRPDRTPAEQPCHPTWTATGTDVPQVLPRRDGPGQVGGAGEPPEQSNFPARCRTAGQRLPQQQRLDGSHRDPCP